MSAVAAPTKFTRGETRVIVARFRGKCGTCKQPIKRGKPIAWSKRDGARHPWCAGVEVPEGFETAVIGEALRVPALVAAERRPAAVVVPQIAPLAGMGRLGLRMPEEPAELAVDDGWWEMIAAGEVRA